MNNGIKEQQKLVCTASAGTFDLSFGDQTATVSYNENHVRPSHTKSLSFKLSL